MSYLSINVTPSWISCNIANIDKGYLNEAEVKVKSLIQTKAKEVYLGKYPIMYLLPENVSELLPLIKGFRRVEVCYRSDNFERIQSILSYFEDLKQPHLIFYKY
jgi:hypothetical protein